LSVAIFERTKSNEEIFWSLAIISLEQLRINELADGLETQKTEQKRLGEKLKIHEQLVNIKAEMKELQMRTSDGKKK